MKEAVRFVMVQLFLPCCLWLKTWSTPDSLWSLSDSDRVGRLIISKDGPQRRLARLTVGYGSCNCPFSKPIYAKSVAAYDDSLFAKCIIKVQ